MSTPIVLPEQILYYVRKINDKSATKTERQHYYFRLMDIRDEINKTLEYNELELSSNR